MDKNKIVALKSPDQRDGPSPQIPYAYRPPGHTDKSVVTRRDAYLHSLQDGKDFAQQARIESRGYVDIDTMALQSQRRCRKLQLNKPARLLYHRHGQALPPIEKTMIIFSMITATRQRRLNRFHAMRQFFQTIHLALQLMKYDSLLEFEHGGQSRELGVEQQGGTQLTLTVRLIFGLE